MIEILRALRLGVVNLFGIAVPGFLLLFLLVLGFLVPGIAAALHVAGPVRGPLSAASSSVAVAVIVAVILSYVVGYILRLSSPDELDLVSAKKVLAQMDAEDIDQWPFRGDEKEKWPYFHLRAYLKARHLEHLLYLVKWGPDQAVKGASTTGKRSKTAVNSMKLEISLRSPALAAAVESNEAHVRLMSGTWLSLRASYVPVMIGLAISIVAHAATHAAWIRCCLPLSNSVLTPGSAPNYLVMCLIGITLLGSMRWSQMRIESLFHYRRVGELVFIVMAAHEAQKLSPESEDDG